MLKFSSISFTVLDPTYERFSIKPVIRYQFINLSPTWLSKTHLHDGWGDPPHVTSPIWGATPPCEQALTESLNNTNNPRVFPYISHNYRYASPQRVWFLSLLVWNWLWFSRELRECMDVVIVSIPNEYERKRNNVNSKCIWRNFLLAL